MEGLESMVEGYANRDAPETQLPEVPEKADVRNAHMDISLLPSLLQPEARRFSDSPGIPSILSRFPPYLRQPASCGSFAQIPACIRAGRRRLWWSARQRGTESQVKQTMNLAGGVFSIALACK